MAACLLWLGLPSAVCSAVQAAGSIWDLSDLYATPQAWAAALAQAQAAAGQEARRARLIAAFQLLEGKRAVTPKKKHGNIPL